MNVSPPIRSLQIAAALGLAATAGLACANGPVRYKTLGFRKSATVELLRRSPLPVTPLAVPCGAVLDLGASTLDTLVDVALFYPLTMTHGGPDARGCLTGEEGVGGTLACGLLSLFWAPTTLIALQIWPEDMYKEIFGPTSGLFAEIPMESTLPNAS